ncbi:MAG TPA: YncE family protein, partial [Opitutaceae bacterium]|nr:YncE family protein [Opitutaceae bacterium]
MRKNLWFAALAAWAASAGAQPPPVLPGPQPDGSTLLHNQWPIRPVGLQIELGNFPVALAVDPSGRYAAAVEAGSAKHQIRIVDLREMRVAQTVAVHQAFGGIAFTPDGRRLVVSGGADNRLSVFAFDRGKTEPLAGIGLPSAEDYVVTAGVAAAPDSRSAFYTQLFTGRVGRVDLATGAPAWIRLLDPAGSFPARRLVRGEMPGIDAMQNFATLAGGSDPLGLAWDRRRERLYVSLWGEAGIAVLDGRDGRELARWPTGLHPNELVLAPDGRRLFVSNGGLNTVTVLDAASGQVRETLTSAIAAQDLPGSTPDSLALTRDGRRLFVANASNNNIAVFDVSRSGHGRAEGFIPTAWFPSAVRLTPDGRRLLVLSARGTRPKPNNVDETTKFQLISGIYQGSLAIIDLPRGGAFDRALAGWTAAAEQCHPAPPAAAPAPGDPIPPRGGGPTPIRYVIYVIKENRTYDQVLGDMPEGNGDRNLCLFPEAVTPN